MNFVNGMETNTTAKKRDGGHAQQWGSQYWTNLILELRLQKKNNFNCSANSILRDINQNQVFCLEVRMIAYDMESGNSYMTEMKGHIKVQPKIAIIN